MFLVHGWARSGWFFCSHLRKELRVVQTKKHPIPLVRSLAFGGYNYMHPGARYPEMSKKMGSFQLDIKAN